MSRRWSVASPRAILAASKAVPGPGRPTPGPQGSVPGLYPSMGQLPQYSMQPQSNYSYGYGPFLPRPPETFTSGAFGPFSPILPVPVDQPAPGSPRPQPRRWSYRVGYNLPVGEPGEDGYKLASFGTLKSLGEYYSIMRTCLEIRKNEIRALDWDIVLTKDAAKAYQGDREAMRDWGERREELLRFFKKPDPNYFDFSSWLSAMLEQVFVYDALSLYLCPTKGAARGTGLLGSGLDSIWAIDGSSIRPLVGLHGEMPAPPAPAFEQYIYGVPRSDYTTMFDGRDLLEEGFTADDLRGEFRGDQLLYLPYVPRVDSPYGLSLVEQAIIPIMTGLRKQAYQLSFFDENTIPGVYISPGDVNMTPTQIRELQDALNALVGQNAVWNFKVIVLPPGSKPMPMKQMEIVDQADEWIATEVAMVASVNPMELGILPKVSTVASPFAAREMAQAQRSIHQRIATKPTLSFVQSIFDLVIQQIARCADTRFLFSGMEEVADQAALTDMGIKQIQSGALSIDEFRDMTGRTPWDLPETSEPIVMTQMGPIPLAQAQDYVQAQVNGQSVDSGSGKRGGSGKKPSSSSGTGAHAAAQGHARALPAGTSGQGRMNGPVTQRQARRGGALAPAHATAEGAPGHSGGKAAAAELEALARHLRKGRLISTWEPAYLPERALSLIAQDMARGLPSDQAVALAKTVVLGDMEYEWLPKAGGSGPKAQQRQANQQQRQAQQARAQAQQLAQQYAARIQQAFATAMGQAATLIAQWASGALVVTLAALVAMIADLIRKALQRVLRALWRKAWALGVTLAEEEAGGKWGRKESGEALKAFLATVGADLAGLISGTRMRQLAEALTQAIRDGEDPQTVADLLERILQIASRVETIAVTEVGRALNAAVLAAFRALGITYKRWVTSGLPNTCAGCLKNQAAGPLPLSAAFPVGGVLGPLLHPNCRCHLDVFRPPQPTASKAEKEAAPSTTKVGDRRQLAHASSTSSDSTVSPHASGLQASHAKALRRQVDLNGQVTLHDAAEPAENAAGGGATGVWPHYAMDSGVQVDIPGGVPGATAGGEPPRWDGTEPEPVVATVPPADDDAAYGSAEGTGVPPGAYFPAPYMDGWWPAPHGIGTQQAPTSSPGGGGPRGRPPGPTGKAAKTGDAASFLASAPKAKASAVYKVMEGNFPADSLGWVRAKGVHWVGPVELPLSLVDFSSESTWSASKEHKRVAYFGRLLKSGKPVDPGIAIVREGHNHARLVDGRHRTLACRKLGIPTRVYVAFVPSDEIAEQALETHASQLHQGSSPQND